VARDLLGRYLVRSLEGERCAVAQIVEAEAYLGAGDPASHAFGNRRTARTRTMFRRGGVAYVYLIYGMHHCLNVVVGPEGEAGAVLLRGAEPIEGVEWMCRNRGIVVRPRPGQIAGGPGKLCQALAVDRGFDGAPLGRGDLVLAAGVPVEVSKIAHGPRIGVDYAGVAASWPLRFALSGHPEMSRPRLGTGDGQPTSL
jgi:DNA-3-methyladenine glycosylase